MRRHASTNAPATTLGGDPPAASRTSSARSRRRWPIIALAVLILAALIAAPTGALAAPDVHRGGGRSNDSGWSGDYGYANEHAYSGGYKWIDIDISNQWLTAYEGDTPVFGAAVSTGIDGYNTPTGDYEILWMLDYETMVGEDYYLPDVPYVMYFAPYLAIHGTYWHENFGWPSSHGCVNLPVWAAGWLYDWVYIGTPVSIHY
jgi:L,D-transpeptidase catalytic domain